MQQREKDSLSRLAAREKEMEAKMGACQDALTKAEKEKEEMSAQLKTVGTETAGRPRRRLSCLDVHSLSLPNHCVVSMKMGKCE